MSIRDCSPLAVVVALLLCSAACGGGGGSGNTDTGEILAPLGRDTADGSGATTPPSDVTPVTTRSYREHLPASGTPPTALVLAFHGGGGTAAGFQDYATLDVVADAEGFLVVYPESMHGNWNDGRLDTGIDGLEEVDDVAFVANLIDRLTREHAIVPGRVFATGISNGGMLCHRLACELSDRIAAIATVAAPMAEDLAPVCQPGRPVSVLTLPGNRDPIMPFDGGPVLSERADRGRVISAADTTAFWRRQDGCADPPATERIDERRFDRTAIHTDTYAPCDAATAVVQMTVDGGGHTWPGARIAPLLGRTSKEIDASEVIWAFFAAHGR
jgi:polyhydroxybutyrate depolymerase